MYCRVLVTVSGRDEYWKMGLICHRYEDVWFMWGTDTPPGDALLAARRWRGQVLFAILGSEK